MFTKNPVGPCAMMDAVGLDTVASIEQHYVKERGLSPKDTVEYVQKYIDQGRLGAKSGKGGLYPPGTTTKTAGDTRGHHDNLHAPTLYFLDIGLSNEPKDVFDHGRILTGGPDGRPLKTLVNHQHLPDGIQLSIPLGKMYWTNMGVPDKNDGAIYSAKLDGSDIKEIVPKGKVHTPKQTFLDHVNKKLYFCDREGLRVMRCNINGSDMEVLIKNGDWENSEHNLDQLRWCVGIAVSPSTGYFYWTQKGPSKGTAGRIFSASIDMPAGSDAATRKDIKVVADNLPEPIDLEVDDDQGVLYWTDRGEIPLGNTLNKKQIVGEAPKSEGTLSREIIAQGFGEAIGLRVDKQKQCIYVADLAGRLWQCSMTAAPKEKIFEAEGHCYTGLTFMRY